MLVTSLRIRNFKRFSELSVGLKPFDCVVGPNNSGKTTLLQGLALFDYCLHHCLSRRNDHWLLKNRSIALEEFYVLPLASPVDLWTDRRTQSRDGHIKIEIGLTFEQEREVTAKLDLNYNRFKLSVDSADQTQEWLEQLDKVRIAYLPVFSMFLPQEERRTPAVVEDELARRRVSTVIRNLLLDLKKHQAREKRLVEILQRVFPDLEDMGIEFDQANDRYISVTYTEHGRPKDFDVFSAGSGFQQFLYLFGFILLREPTVILLDEPDVHLHGTLQEALLRELEQFVGQGKQVLFATHSRKLISNMSPERILTLEERAAKRLSVSFDLYDLLDHLGAVDPTQLPVVQAYRRVLVVEDQADWDILVAFCCAVLGIGVWQQVERRMGVCHARGNPWKQDMSKLRSQLQQMITIAGRPLEMFVVADRDYCPDLEDLRASLPSHCIHWHVWERVEIENYLLCPDAILRVLTGDSAAPPLPKALFEQPLRDEFQRLLEESRDSAQDHLVEAFGGYSRRHDEGWDAVTLSRKAREFIETHWETAKLALADAKDVVLPGMKRWAQRQDLGQFTDRSLARAILPDELPGEVHSLATGLAHFAGIAPSPPSSS